MVTIDIFSLEKKNEQWNIIKQRYLLVEQTSSLSEK